MGNQRNQGNLHDAGMYGQKEAEEYLLKKGCQILKRNYRIRTGEIDIIALDRGSGYIAFVEVKYRRGLGHGLPREAVTKAKQRHIIRTAMHYISANSLDSQDFRFDVVEVLDRDGQIYVNHIENAFDT